MTAKSFASTEDTGEKKVSFDQIGAGLYAYTAEGDPNSGIIVGDDSVIGAHAVVLDSIPPGGVAIGMPAKVIKVMALRSTAPDA